MATHLSLLCRVRVLQRSMVPLCERPFVAVSRHSVSGRPEPRFAPVNPTPAIPPHAPPDMPRTMARAIVMPNLRPPVTTTAAAVAYRDRILAARPPGSDFQPLMTLYLTDATPPSEIDAAVASGVVHAVKLYPAGVGSRVVDSNSRQKILPCQPT